jgi:hypothetical protein
MVEKNKGNQEAMERVKSNNVWADCGHCGDNQKHSVPKNSINYSVQCQYCQGWNTVSVVVTTRADKEA